MPDKKNPIVRYMVLDSCFRNRRKRYYIDDLLEAVNNYMRVHSFQPISERQLRDDINFMEYDAGEDIELLRIQDGHSKYYQYRDPGMSMFKHQLTDDEAALISNTVNKYQSTIGVSGSRMSSSKAAKRIAVLDIPKTFLS